VLGQIWPGLEEDIAGTVNGVRHEPHDLVVSGGHVVLRPPAEG
jgi:hypothetical protein